MMLNFNNLKIIFSIIIIFAAYFWLYFGVISDMVLEWYKNPDNSHGFIIPFMTGYFIYKKAEFLKKVIIKPLNSGIIIIMIGLIFFIIGYLGAAYTTMRISMLIVLAGIILSIIGSDFFKLISFPFFYLIFMIPVPRYLYDSLSFPLRIIVTKYSVLFLQLLEFPAFREGNMIMLENMNLQVIDVCSGIRSITSLVAIATAFAYMIEKNNLKRLAIIILAVPISIISNGCRIIITAILGRYFGPQIADNFFHQATGIVVFITSIVILICSGWFLKEK